MAAHTRWYLVLVAVLLLCVGAAACPAGAALAMPLPQVGLDGGISYSAELADSSGQPVADGQYDFVFTFYDSATGGDRLWTETQTGLAVAAGRVEANLGAGFALSRQVQDHSELWLEIEVRGPGETVFTTLAPRQPIDPNGPAAVTALTCPHSHFTDAWTGSNTVRGLRVENTGTGDGIQAVSLSTSDTWSAVYALNSATTGEGNAVTGVSGAPSSITVQGRNNAAAGGIAMAGFQSGYDVTVANAWWARPAAVFAGKWGLVGVAKGTGGFGVVAQYQATTGLGYGLEAENFSPDGWAGQFWSSNGNGVRITAGAGKTGLVVSGGSKSAAVATDSGERLLYTEESTEVWFTDYGFGKLSAGQASITIQPLFAQTVNLAEPYHVFLQAYGDAGIYVTNRTPTGFEVRLRGGDPAVEFSYRLVARRLGFETLRLESAPAGGNGTQSSPPSAVQP